MESIESAGSVKISEVFLYTKSPCDFFEVMFSFFLIAKSETKHVEESHEAPNSLQLIVGCEERLKKQSIHLNIIRQVKILSFMKKKKQKNGRTLPKQL